MLRGEEVSWETETHRQYGEVVRLGPDRLSYINPQAWKDIAGAGAGKRLENTKDPSTLGPDIHGTHSLGSQPEAMVHRSQRRVFAPAFSDKALKLQEPLILGYLNSLVRIIRNYAIDVPTDGFDLAKLLNCTTFDIMADLAFGEPLGLLEQSELTPWVQAMLGNVQRMSVSRVAREYKILNWLIKAVTPKKVTQGAQLHYNHSYERVEKRLDRGIDIEKPDIWRLAMEENDDGSCSGFYDGGIGDDCNVTERSDFYFAETSTLHAKAAGRDTSAGKRLTEPGESGTSAFHERLSPRSPQGLSARTYRFLPHHTQGR